MILGTELALKNVMQTIAKMKNPPALYKFDVLPDARLRLLKELSRMNITYATLFPGLDGFARSSEISAAIRAIDLDALRSIDEDI